MFVPFLRFFSPGNRTLSRNGLSLHENPRALHHEQDTKDKERKRLQRLARPDGPPSARERGRLCQGIAVRHSLNNYSVYGIFFHDEADIDLDYGCGKYDYKKGTVICVAPGQIGGKEDNGERVKLTGWVLLFHPDLLHGTPLERTIRTFSFFDYRINEALHMTEQEHDLLVSLMRLISDELDKRRDELQDTILVGYIGLVLNYCQRFYNRQFLTRKIENNDILARFDDLLRSYYEQKQQLTLGLPTVQYCAERLCMSANYFGDLVKKTTGDTASNYIRQYVIQQAKNMLAAGCGTAQAAIDLGFQYPQHLSRMFKRQTGITPSEYCRQLRR